MSALLTTETVMHEAIASAYGNRHPDSRQYERDEMAGAAIARTRSRMTDHERLVLRQRLAGLGCGAVLAKRIVDDLAGVFP